MGLGKETNLEHYSRRWALKTGSLGLGALAAAVVSGCSTGGPAERAGSASASAMASPSPTATASPRPTASLQTVYPSRSQVVAKFKNVPAGQFGLEVPGIELGLPKGNAAAALTFDACGGPRGSGVDGALLDALRAKQVPATLFVNERWARANAPLMAELASDELFEIANHGTSHAPLATSGQAAYGIGGTESIGQAYDEVMGNQRYLADQFGITAKFFRSGTAHMDEAGAAMCRDLGVVPMNFTVNLDAGATFGAQAVAAQVRQLAAGDVGIGHFNQPASGTAKGVALGLGQALDSGLRFTTLSEAW